ncbi:MAG: phenylalanine--tRNA ligase subunit beta [Proteobacteria bacterium]|nr:phenylalanine--tRNA ligase subunit beta [Pseudomonadota bacterium]
MKFTLGWLKTHLETSASLAEITGKLTMIGLELESVEDRAAGFAPFIVGHVVEAKRHPDADRLSVCIVDTGRERVQVVCGAPNARTGMKGVFAASGTTIPGTGMQLKASTIRGVASHGMLCPAREMGLSDEHEGIIDLPADAPVGQPFAAVLGLDDPVIDIAVTPNRADCLGVRGIARDLAAAGLGTLKPRLVEPVAGRFKSPIGVRFDLAPDIANACPLFVGRLIRGVKNGPSPKWLQDRLGAIGLRPISALVDMTNFMTLDVNRPLHVFDADTLAGGITVRLARAGEKVQALNGKEYVLDGSETAIADDDGALGLGGVIGGVSSGCTEGTTNVFIEAALFDPVRTAATGRRHQIVSDARYRFERGLDLAAVIEGMEAATRLVMELCGGEPSELVVTGKPPDWHRSYALRLARIHALGGVDVPRDEAVRILAALGFAVAVAQGGDGVLAVTPPSWRGDVQGEADLVEEIVRIHGYERIPAVPLPRDTALPLPALNPPQRRARDARRALAGLGLTEAVTFSFMSSGHAALFGAGNAALRLANPISAELDMMRPSILPNLLLAAKRNADRGLTDAGLFEVGPQYSNDTPSGQALVATALRSGASFPRHWGAPSRPIDALDAKGDALGLLAALGLAIDNVQVTTDAPGWYHPGRSGVMRLGPKTTLAYFGEIHPAVLAKLDVKGPAVGCEVFLGALPPPKAKASKARPLLRLSPFQPVERDFAFVLDAGVAAEQVIKAAKSADKALIAAVSVFDLYQGKGVPDGKKSLAISVKLQPTTRTLTDAEIEAVGQRVVAAVIKATGATLRA